MLNPAIERQTFFKKTVFQWLKAKKLLKIWNLLVETKKNTENLKPIGWKQKNYWKILNPPIEIKKELRKFWNLWVERKTVLQWLKTKSCLRS